MHLESMARSGHRRSSVVVGSVAALALGLVLAACGSSGSPNASSSTSNHTTKSPLNVGMVVALTGYLTAIDGPYVDGAKLAASIINKSGGVDGHRIDLHIADGQSSTTAGVTAANQLINQDNVSAMVNGASSATNQAIVPVISAHDIPTITQGQLPPTFHWLYLATAAYQKDLEIQMSFVKDHLHATSIAFLYSQTPYGELGVKALPTMAKKYGLKVVLNQAVTASSSNLSTVMAQVKAAKPGAVIDFLTGSTHIVEAEGAATVSLGIPIVMGIDATSPIRSATKAYSDTYFVASPAQVYPSISDAALKKATGTFVTAYKKSGGDMSVIGTAGYGWDAVQMLAQAVRKSHAVTGSKLEAALTGMTLQGSESLYKFTATDHTGQASIPNPLSIAQVTGTSVKVVYTAS